MTDTMTIETMLRRLHDRLGRHGHAITTEESIKAVLVSPFLTGLGHDVSDPDMVRVGVRNEQGRADYIVLNDDGLPNLYAAVVPNPEDLEAQRIRAVVKMVGWDNVAILLTNGRRYHFHLRREGTFAETPFLAFDAGDDIVDPAVLVSLARGSFDLDAAIAAGRTTRLHELAWDKLLEEADADGEIRATLAKLIDPRGTTPERAHAGAADALARLGRVMRDEEPPVQRTVASVDEDDERRPLNNEEIAALDIVKSIAGDVVNPARIFARPAQSYAAVLLDNNNRKTVARLYFSAHSTRYIGTFVGRTETKHKIENHVDIQRFAAAITNRLHDLDPGAPVRQSPPAETIPAETPGDTVDAAGIGNDAGEETAPQHTGILASFHAAVEHERGALESIAGSDSDHNRDENRGRDDDGEGGIPPGYRPADDAWRSEGD